MSKIYDPMAKLRESAKSFRAAINARRWYCQGRDSDPESRWCIGSCEMCDRGLHAFRPCQINQPRSMSAVLHPDDAQGDSDLIQRSAV